MRWRRQATRSSRSARRRARPAARRAVSLLMLHMLVTLGPALLPILGWLAESTVGKWVQLALFPLMLICLVPHLDQLVYSAP